MGPCVGDGGGCISSSSSARIVLRSSGESGPGVDPDDALACFCPALPLAADLIDCVSALSSDGDVTEVRAVDELRGLSADLPLPGILVRSAVRSDRADSLVSDLLKDGYEYSDGPEPVGVCEPGVPVPLPSFSLDGWFPIVPDLLRGCICQGRMQYPSNAFSATSSLR